MRKKNEKNIRNEEKLQKILFNIFWADSTNGNNIKRISILRREREKERNHLKNINN